MIDERIIPFQTLDLPRLRIHQELSTPLLRVQLHATPRLGTISPPQQSHFPFLIAEFDADARLQEGLAPERA